MAQNFACELNDEKSPPPYYPDPTEQGGISSTPPPSYSQTQNEPPPPSYDTLFGEIRAAQRNAEGRGHFLKSVGKIILDTSGFTISVCVLLSIPILMIVVGALNLNNCPVDRLIPIWLVVGGSLLGALQLTSIAKRIRKKYCPSTEAERSEQTHQYAGLYTLFTFISIGWFFAGNVWTYRVYPPGSDFSDDDYCDHTTYYLSFWLITLSYMAALCFCCCSCCLASCITPGRSSGDNN